MLLRRKQKLRLKSCHHYNIKQALGGVCNSQLILLQDERWFGKFRVLSSFLNKILQQLLMHAYTHVLTPRPLSLSVSLFLIPSPLSQQCSGGCVGRRVLGIEWLSGIIFFGVIIHTHAHTHTLSHSLSCTHSHTHSHVQRQFSKRCRT